MTLPATSVALIVAAIWHVEGGHRAKVPYGILSVRVRSEQHAKQVCERTVVNNWARWQTQGRPGECFLDFLADRYCPPSADNVGNRRWKRNIKSRLRHVACDCQRFRARHTGSTPAASTNCGWGGERKGLVASFNLGPRESDKHQPGMVWCRGDLEVPISHMAQDYGGEHYRNNEGLSLIPLSGRKAGPERPAALYAYAE